MSEQLNAEQTSVAELQGKVAWFWRALGGTVYQHDASGSVVWHDGEQWQARCADGDRIGAGYGNGEDAELWARQACARSWALGNHYHIW